MTSYHIFNSNNTKKPWLHIIYSILHSFALIITCTTYSKFKQVHCIEVKKIVKSISKSCIIRNGFLVKVNIILNGFFVKACIILIWFYWKLGLFEWILSDLEISRYLLKHIWCTSQGKVVQARTDSGDSERRVSSLIRSYTVCILCLH